jgi:RNA polymerase sigma factor (sigma-70 family)
MASAQVGEAVRRAPGGGSPASADAEGALDSELLERFIGRRDQAAFEALVVRHGPRVLAVCRQVLGESEEAHDAFQATFLVLVRKAGAIRKRDSLGPWLHGVARRIAVRAKVRGERRRTQEGWVVEMHAKQASSDLDHSELRPLLDEEMSRLPEKYRLPLLLCYLEGMTNEEAARRLECPPGTLKGRLARAREILKGRLARRGVVLGGGLMLWLSSTHSASASAYVPANLIAATVKSSVLAAQGKLAAARSLSPNVAAMVEDALTGLFLAKVARIATALLALAAISASVLYVASAPAAGGGRSLVAKTILKPTELLGAPAGGACH